MEVTHSLWDRRSSITEPNGVTSTAEQFLANPTWAFLENSPVVLSKRDGVVVGVNNLFVLMGNYGVSHALPEKDAFNAVVKAMEQEQERQVSLESLSMPLSPFTDEEIQKLKTLLANM